MRRGDSGRGRQIWAEWGSRTRKPESAKLRYRIATVVSIRMNHVATSPLLLVHGGAGVIRRDMDADTERGVRAALAEALRRGHVSLAAGGSALDAVTAAVVVLEDAPYFNAGHGAVFTHDGVNELDAAIMDGATLRAGAVAGVRHVRNPVLLARAVMEHSSHVMLAGEGAEAFAHEQGITLVNPDYFRTDRRWRELQAAQRQASRNEHVDHFGTVGAVALDAQGRLAAATSTGGMTDKRWGRIGDSPLIGAGTYVNAACAMSGTGRAGSTSATPPRTPCAWGWPGCVNRCRQPPGRWSTERSRRSAAAARSCWVPMADSRCRPIPMACFGAILVSTRTRAWRSGSTNAHDLAQRAGDAGFCDHRCVNPADPAS